MVLCKLCLNDFNVEIHQCMIRYYVSIVLTFKEQRSPCYKTEEADLYIEINYSLFNIRDLNALFR